MKKIKFSQHSLDKIRILKKHGIIVNKEVIKEIILKPQQLEKGYKGRLVAQGNFDKDRVLRIIYEELTKDKIIVITLYPGRKERYEKN
jgi:hypothetical protein